MTKLFKGHKINFVKEKKSHSLYKIPGYTGRISYDIPLSINPEKRVWARRVKMKQLLTKSLSVCSLPSTLQQIASHQPKGTCLSLSLFHFYNNNRCSKVKWF